MPDYFVGNYLFGSKSKNSTKIPSNWQKNYAEWQICSVDDTAHVLLNNKKKLAKLSHHKIICLILGYHQHSCSLGKQDRKTTFCKYISSLTFPPFYSHGSFNINKRSVWWLWVSENLWITISYWTSSKRCNSDMFLIDLESGLQIPIIYSFFQQWCALEERFYRRI